MRRATLTLHDLQRWLTRHLTHAENEVLRLKQLQRMAQPSSDMPAPMQLDDPADIFFWQGRRGALLDLERLLDIRKDIDEAEPHQRHK